MKAPRFLAYPIGAMLLVVLAVVCFIPVLVYLLYLLAEAIWFRFSSRGKVYLVYTRRHGWNEFLCNNLFPSIPADIEPVEYPRGCIRWRSVLSHVYAAGKKKPYLVKVSWNGLRYIDLHERLLPFKQFGAQRMDVQTELSLVLADQVGSGAT